MKKWVIFKHLILLIKNTNVIKWILYFRPVHGRFILSNENIRFTIDNSSQCWQRLNQEECFCTAMTAAVLSTSFYKAGNSILKYIFGFGKSFSDVQQVNFLFILRIYIYRASNNLCHITCSEVHFLVQIVVACSYGSTFKNMPWDLIMSNSNYQQQFPDIAGNQWFKHMLYD